VINCEKVNFNVHQKVRELEAFAFILDMELYASDQTIEFSIPILEIPKVKDHRSKDNNRIPKKKLTTICETNE